MNGGTARCCVLTFVQAAVPPEEVLGGAVKCEVGANDDACAGGRSHHSLVQPPHLRQPLLQPRANGSPLAAGCQVEGSPAGGHRSTPGIPQIPACIQMKHISKGCGCLVEFECESPLMIDAAHRL